MKHLLSALLILAMILSPASGSALAANGVAEADDVLGVRSEQTYANAFLGLMAVFGEGWYILDDDEIVQTMGYDVESPGNRTLAELFRSSGVVCDLYALARDGSGDSLNIQIEDLGFLYGLVTSEDVYAEEQLSQLTSALVQVGFADPTVEKAKADFAGREHTVLLIRGTIQGVPVYERIALVKAGSCMAAVTAFSLDEARAAAMLDLFEGCSAENPAA